MTLRHQDVGLAVGRMTSDLCTTNLHTLSNKLHSSRFFRFCHARKSLWWHIHECSCVVEPRLSCTYTNLKCTVGFDRGEGAGWPQTAATQISSKHRGGGQRSTFQTTFKLIGSRFYSGNLVRACGKRCLYEPQESQFNLRVSFPLLWRKEGKKNTRNNDNNNNSSSSRHINESHTAAFTSS